MIVQLAPGQPYRFRNDGDSPRDVGYASLTAPTVIRCEVRIDGELWDAVYAGAGGSHSWWTSAGGKLLPHQGLLPGQELQVTTDGPAAFRVDWLE
jgi:hypothetical protein